MSLYYKDSVEAKINGRSTVLTGYHNDDNIACIDIKDVLDALTSNNYGFKGMPTKEQLKKALEKIKAFYLELISEDFDFYAREVIPKFLYYVKE